MCKCPACGHEEELITGLGWRGVLQVEQERKNILAGEYGPKAQAILMAHPETLVDIDGPVSMPGLWQAGKPYHDPSEGPCSGSDLSAL